MGQIMCSFFGFIIILKVRASGVNILQYLSCINRNNYWITEKQLRNPFSNAIKQLSRYLLFSYDSFLIKTFFHILSLSPPPSPPPEEREGGRQSMMRKVLIRKHILPLFLGEHAGSYMIEIVVFYIADDKYEIRIHLACTTTLPNYYQFICIGAFCKIFRFPVIILTFPEDI